jgi:putative endonuclease
MLSGRITHLTVRALDWLAERTLPPEMVAAHQRTGRRGEEAAYFHLRRLGYVMVAANFRSPHHRGEVDLIGWKDDILCFIEVKTRTSHAVKPAEAAVDREKQGALVLVCRDFLHNLGFRPQYRFDVLSVYYDVRTKSSHFVLFQNAFPVA